MNRQQRAPLPPIVGMTTGARNYSKIISGKKTGFYELIVRAQITLAGAVAAVIYNGGSVVSLLDFVGVEDNGDDRAYWPALSMLALTQRMGFNADTTTNVRLTSLADGVYNLVEKIIIPFAWDGPGGSGAPWETAHVQPDPRQDSFVFAVPNADVTRLVDAGGTITTPLSITVTQVFDDQRASVLPYFVPRFRWIQQSIPGAVVELPFYIRATNPMRGILFSQVDSVAGIVTDIVDAVQLLDDAADGIYIGPRAEGFESLAMHEARKYGAIPILGNSAAAGAPSAMRGLGTYFHNWQDSGRLSTIYNPASAGNNLRMTITGQPSVVGGGSAAVYGAIIELEQIPGRTAIPVRADGAPLFTF